MKITMRARCGRALRTAVAATCLLAAGGCVVGDEEFEAAQRERDQNLNDAQVMVADNDRLNREIARIYNDCDVLASQVAMVSAASLHNRLTAGIGRPAPEPPAPPARPAATTRSSRPAGDDTNRRAASETETSTPRNSGGQGSAASGGSTAPPRGGNPSAPSGGSLDWGSLTSF